MPISGSLELIEFLKRIWSLDSMPSSDSRFSNATGDIFQHVVNNRDWDIYYLLDTYLGLLKGSDDQFLHFLEEVVHPVVRQENEQVNLVELINGHLIHDNYQLRPVSQLSSRSVYRAVRLKNGVSGRVKNIIFAADGPKPEIVLEDSISNHIRITANESYCLVYDQEIPKAGLLWVHLVDWWAAQQDTQTSADGVGRSLYLRLLKSLASEPEKLLFDTYFRRLRPDYLERLPALIPQVYLHYDPYTLKQKQLNGEKRLPRQRMDFLLLFSNNERIVIEVDGKQHYSSKERADPEKYAEMVAEDRRLQLTGYDMYRFGGYELQGDQGRKIVEEFFRQLFHKHRIGG
jgi:very-short-patch-repair endonuclease